MLSHNKYYRVARDSGLVTEYSENFSSKDTETYRVFVELDDAIDFSKKILINNLNNLKQQVNKAENRLDNYYILKENSKVYIK